MPPTPAAAASSLRLRLEPLPRQPGILPARPLLRDPEGCGLATKGTRLCPVFPCYLRTSGWALRVQAQRGQPHPCGRTKYLSSPKERLPQRPHIWSQEVAAEPPAGIAQFGLAARNSAGRAWSLVKCPGEEAAELGRQGSGIRGYLEPISDGWRRRVGWSLHVLNLHLSRQQVMGVGEERGLIGQDRQLRERGTPPPHTHVLCPGKAHYFLLACAAEKKGQRRL